MIKNYLFMKKLFFLLLATMVVTSSNAQTKTAYLDLYQRGGGKNLKTTLLFEEIPIELERKNIGEILNDLAKLGWEVDKTISVQRFSIITRHKFHIILKKEYQESEDPFLGLYPTNFKNSHDKFDSNTGELTVEYVVYDLAYSFRDDIYTVIISESVTEIGYRAFAFMPKLTTVYLKSETPPTLNYRAFSGINKNAKIYVPMNAVEKYKNAEGWKYYAKMIVGYELN